MTVLAILGPTASGKSELAEEVVRWWQGAGRSVELVAVDAFTIYRGMDIGTAKPSAQARAAVPHHLVDELDPWDELSVAWFQRRARAALQEIRSRGGVPLLVGGSGLYWRAVVDDLRFPPTEPDVRSALEDRWWNDPAGAHRRLAELDPAAAASIEPDNVRRVVRALEVMQLTGQRFSTFQDAWDRYESRYADLRVAYLEPEPDQLRPRIHARADQMVQDGLLDEAAELRRLHRPPSRTASQAIGYAEAFQVLDGTLSVDELPRAIGQRTWRYAKRQRAWFRTDPRCKVTDWSEALDRLAPA